MKKFLIILIMLIGIAGMFAAVTGYTMAYTAGTYTGITGGAVLGTATNDDTSFNNLPIGFTFTYNEAGYTAFSVNSNGFLAMGTTVSSSYTPISTGSTNNVISALGRDLQGNATTSELSYLTIGTAPNRTLVVQWKDYKKYGTSGTGDIFNFQIRLNETSNTIDLVYGAFTNNATSSTYQVGLRGASSADYRNVTSTTSWDNPPYGTANSASMTISATVLPASGTTYTWTAPPITTPPNAAISPIPANAATGVLPTAILSWASGGGGPTGYKVYFGTDNPPATMVSDQATATYDPVPNMNPSTVYYWQIIPYNIYGDATGCPVWSFTTSAGVAPTLTTPADAAVNQPRTGISFSWSSVGADSYKIKLGTTSGGTDVLDNVIVTSPYVLGINLNWNTTYYWSITAVFADLSEYASLERTFTTMVDPTVYSFPYIVDFGTTTSDLFPPLNWTRLTGPFAGTHTSSTSYWFQDDWVNVITPANKAGKMNIWSTSIGWLVTPPIQLPGAGYELKFDIGLTVYAGTTAVTPGGQPDDRFIVAIADNPLMNGATILREWNNTGSPYVYDNIPNTGINHVIDLSAYTGAYYIAFYGESTVSNGDNDFFVDNVWVRETPAAPVMFVSPASWTVGPIAVGGTATQVFNIMNAGGGILNITDAAINGAANFTIISAPTWPVALGPGVSTNVTVQYTGVMGTQNATLDITNDLSRVTVSYPLQGTGAYLVNMTNGSTTLAEGESWGFYDSGGPAGQYQNSEDYTYTFYPATGYLVHSAFSFFSTEGNFDYLFVYDGPDITAPLLGTYHGAVTIPEFTSTHASGALTFRFTSDSSVQYDGWAATISLVPRPVDPVFQYSPAALSFSTPVNGTSSWQNVTVSNSGGGILNLAVTDVVITGTDAAMFEYDAVNLPAALATGESVVIPVRFIPTTEGAKTATMRMTYAAVDYDVALNGTSTPVGLVTIGNGTSDLQLPIYPYYGYTYSQTIYLQSELNISDQVITKVYYYWNGFEYADVSDQWVIYMGHTAETAFATTTSWIPLANLTQVFSGEVLTSTTPGWIEIILNTPFAYNNVDNLVIAVEENETGYDSSSGYFYSTAATTNRSILYYSDTTNPDPAAPPTALYLRQAYPNTQLQFFLPVAEPPATPVLTSPADLATGLPKAGFNLAWTNGAGGGIPVDYVVYLSDDPLDVMGQNSWVTTGLSYNPVTQGGYTFDYEGVYYWTVVARNTYGNSTAATSRQFTIEAEAMYNYLLLDGDVVGDDITLNWQLSMVDGTGEWIGWDSGTNFDAIGTGGAAVFSVASKFSTTDLAPYVGQDLTAIKFFPYKNFASAPTQASTYTVKVWTGTDVDMAPVTEVWSQVVSGHTFNEWNEVLLTTPVPITGTDALYIGYEVNTTAGHPAGCDAGPALVGIGDLIQFGGAWASMYTAYGLNYNWNLEGYVQAAPPIRGELLNIPVVNTQIDTQKLASIRFTTDPDFAQQPTRLLQGYNVYRNDVLQTPTPITATTYLDSNLPNAIYTYHVDAVYETGTLTSNDWIGEVNVILDRPDAPILVAPANLSTNLPISGIQFSWTQGIGGGYPNGYIFSMADDAERLFSVEDSYMADIPDLSHTPVYAYAYSTTYYWAVIAYNNFGDSEPSTVWSFTTRDMPTGITVFPWDEDFENPAFPPDMWTTVDVDGAGTFWQNTLAYNHTTGGTNAALHVYSTAVPDPGQNGWLITPPVTVPVGLNMILSWWNYNVYPTWLVYNGVKVNTVADPAAPGWVELWSATTAASAWSNAAVNISAYGGQTVYFAFNYQGYDGDNWIVDDVSIFELTVDTTPPSITFLPVLNTPREDLPNTVYADIVDDATWNNPIGGATLFYSVNAGPFTPVPMTLDVAPTYMADIPAQPLDSQVDYYIEAWDILDNTATTATYTFYVEDPTWVWYDTGGTGWTWFGAGQAFSPLNVFMNPFYGTGNAVQVNAVDGAAYDVAAATQVLATLHVYSWDGVSDLDLANFTDLTGPIPVTFVHLEYQVIDLTAYNVQVTDPYFIVLYELPVSAAFLFDGTYDYGMTFAVIDGLIYSLSNPGMWSIGANVGTGMSLALDTPVVTISQTAGVVSMSWDAITGASSYLVYASDDAYAADPWTMLASTDLLTYTYTGTEAYKFFKVVASSEAPIVRATLGMAPLTLSNNATRSLKTIKAPVTGLRK